MAEHLDIIKFVCRDFWSEVFQKQVRSMSPLSHNNFDYSQKRTGRLLDRKQAGTAAWSEPQPS